MFFIRYKAKWVHEVEKLRQYFCNLENRNYVSKPMHSLISDNSQHLRSQDEVLIDSKPILEWDMTFFYTEKIYG